MANFGPRSSSVCFATPELKSASVIPKTSNGEVNIAMIKTGNVGVTAVNPQK